MSGGALRSGFAGGLACSSPASMVASQLRVVSFAFVCEFIMVSSKDDAETDEQPLDLKPLRSLAPMFPTPPGYDVSSGSADPPFVYITPIFRPCSSSEHPLKVTPISTKFPTPRHKDESADEESDEDYDPLLDEGLVEDYNPFCNKRKPASLKRASKKARGAADSNATDIKQRPVRRNLIKELVAWRSSLGSTRESVEATATMFDSLRRHMLQLAEKEGSSKRTDLKASALMNQNNLKINDMKMIGPVPGVEIGDIFFYWVEMNILGLHVPTRAMAGIDYLPAGEDGSLVVSIIASGGYENDEDDTDTLVYKGQGGDNRYGKLERRMLALLNSETKENQIRVVRSVEDPFIQIGKVYIYDGIYQVKDCSMVTPENGFSVFKYKLKRKQGQPDGISVWKMTEEWKANPASRKKVIMLDLSSEVENLPVCVVNDVDDEKIPSSFKYVTAVKHSRPLSRNKPLQNCKCPSTCLPGDTNCSCMQQNGGDLPYSSSGVLAKHVTMLYECSSDCSCSQKCRNKVAQKGVKLNFEVFRTGDRGWGLRSWDPIRAGTFVCEYAGEVIDETKHVEEDDYTFRSSVPNDKALRYNLGAELLQDASTDATAESFKQLPIVISAKYAGNVSRFINHSCSPNLLWQAVQYDHGDDSYPHIMFFAMKHIPPMTELTYDYGIRGAPPGIKGKSPQACQLKACLCGSTNCRGSF